MTTLREIEQAFDESKAAYRADKSEANYAIQEAWRAIVIEARNIVRTALPNYEGYTADQRGTVTLETLGWEPLNTGEQ